MAVRADDVDLIRDRSLVESCQAGDTAAFADLYERYYQRLYRFCLRRLHSPHEAEEVAQEAFARAFTAMPRFAGERRFYPWLTVIAGRLCVDSHRRVARTEPTAEIDLGGTEGGQQRIIDNVDRELLATALDNLGPRHREVLALRETEGWSYQQIADHYDVSMGTVEALLFRARKALRREFLAVAGDGGRLAALPVLGVAFGRLAEWRLRVQSWAEHVTPAAAAASAAAMVAVVGGVAVVGQAPDGSARPAPAPIIVERAASAAVPVPSTVAPVVAPAAPTATKSAAPTKVAKPSLAAQAVRPLGQGTAVGGPQALRRRPHQGHRRRRHDLHRPQRPSRPRPDQGMRRAALVVVLALSRAQRRRARSALLDGAVPDGPDMLLGSPVGGHVPDVFNPPTNGDSRHVCVIHDKLDWYTCVYIPMP